uniref:chaperonin GroEL n=1 Tax=Anaerosporobacter sp. TaxID=1872529 RepID=UPI00286F7CD8
MNSNIITTISRDIRKAGDSMIKEMRYNKDAIQTMAEGMLLVCNLLESTYGPFGLSVVMENASNSAVITNRSAQIMQDFKSEDLFLNEGVQLLCDAVLNMGERVGDGSTVTALFVKGMVEEGLRYLAAGANPVFLRQGLKRALRKVLHNIDASTEMVQEHDSLIKAVQASCKDYEIAKMAIEAYGKVSRQGVVLVKPSKSVENYVVYEEGMCLKQGYLSPLFCTKGKDSITYSNPYILITDYCITDFKSILPILEQVMPTGRAIIIVAEEVAGEALTMLIHNHTQGVFKTAVVKAEGYKSRKTDLLEDIAVLTGGVVLKEGKGDELEKVGLSMLGTAKEVRITKDSTTIIGGKGQDWQIANRIKEIQEIILDEKTNEYDKEKYYERIGRLKSGVAVLYAGGRTSQEIRENKVCMETAVKAVRNILEGGMIPGGGSFLWRQANALEEILLYNIEDSKEEGYGVKLLQSACRMTMKILCKLNDVNAGIV